MMTSQNWLRLTVMVILLMSFICIFVVLDGEKSLVSNVRGTFTVRGTKIYDPKGNEFIIKGVNIDGPHWVWSFDMTRYADMIATVWKFNLVRVNTMLKGENWQDDVDVERIVNAFTSRGVVVMFEVHNWTGNYPNRADLNMLVNWHKRLARKYKNNPYVWFDIYNEPGDCNGPVPAQWLTVHQAVVKAIRDDAGAVNVVVAEGYGWAQETGCSSAGEPVATNMSAILSYGHKLLRFNGRTYANIAFNLHVYCGWNLNPNTTKMNDYFNRVAALNLAIFVGEFGVVGGGNCDATPSVQLMYSVVVPRHIGRVVWHWYGGDGNNLTKTPYPSGGWKIDNPTKPTNLTWLGQQVWNDTHVRVPL